MMDQLAYLLGLEVVRAALLATLLIAASFSICSLRRRQRERCEQFLQERSKCDVDRVALNPERLP